MQTTVLRVVTGASEAAVPAGAPFVIGRARTSDFVIADNRVSRKHLVIEQTNVGWSVRDISSNGTWVDGQRMQSVDVHGEVRLRLGTPTGPEVLVLLEGDHGGGGGYDQDYDMQTMLPGQPGSERSHGRMSRQDPQSTGLTSLDREHQRRSAYRLRPGTMSMGRGRNNDIVIGDLLASRNHAELYVGRHGVDIVDLDSANGTFVNGQRINRAPIGQGDVIAVGHHVFQLEGDELVEYIDSGDVSFEADGLNVWAGPKQLMHDMTFRLPGRALLGVVGPSGAGKSTLLNALTGFKPADKGSVRYAGRDLYSEYDELRRRIGYVPQEDLLHTSLTVRKALEFGAELRFPPDTTKNERRVRVDEVLAELGLTQHANTQVSRLSGGQRKRTSVALELLTRPTLLYLDEPTSGLDPGMDKNVMESLRKLADDGRTVIVVTHSVAQLDLCDFVLVLAPGGHVAYFGPPGDSLTFFGMKDYPDVFQELEKTPGKESAARFRQSRYYVPGSVTAPSARPAPEDLPSIRQQPVAKQLITLSRRTFGVVASDKSYLRLIIAFPFLLGLIPVAITGPLLPVEDGTKPNSAASTVLLIMVLCACFMGMANSVREIVKERAIYRRERAIGLSRTAYVGSKILVLAIITVLQAIPFTFIGLAARKLPEPVILPSIQLEFLLAVIVVAMASAMLGLVISALVDNADKTMPLLVLITMAQLVFSGGIVPVEGKPGLEQVSYIAPARWGYAALASAADINTLNLAGKTILDIEAQKRPDIPREQIRQGMIDQGQEPDKPINSATTFDPLWKHDSKTYLIDLGAGVGIGILCVIGTSLLIRRMDPKASKRRPEPVQR